MHDVRCTYRNEKLHACSSVQAAQLDFDGVIVAAPYSYVEFTKCIKSRSWDLFNARWVSSSVSAPLHALFDRVPFNRRHIVGDPSTARQMARLRCGYTSSNEFLHRHGLAHVLTLVIIVDSILMWLCWTRQLMLSVNVLGMLTTTLRSCVQLLICFRVAFSFLMSYVLLDMSPLLFGFLLS